MTKISKDELITSLLEKEQKELYQVQCQNQLRNTVHITLMGNAHSATYWKTPSLALWTWFFTLKCKLPVPDVQKNVLQFLLISAHDQIQSKWIS